MESKQALKNKEDGKGREVKVKRALISVSNKDGLAEFAKGLNELGIEIISTGGTAKAISDAGVKVKKVDEVTGFPEMLDGRVKTLHPKIHGALLAERKKKEHLEQLKEAGIEQIDMVVVNLYPFKETIAKPDVKKEDAIENIDIGGPTMIRSAAKNYESVAVITNPKRYEEVIKELEKKGEVSAKLKEELAIEAFDHTSSYDAAIYKYLSGQKFNPSLKLEFKKIQDLRYGENPHQEAAYYGNLDPPPHSLATAKQLHGKELSFNNILDLDAAWSMASEFSVPAAVVVKHTNPCGVAIDNSIFEAYQDAYACDPVSAFGGVVAINKTVNKEVAAKIAETYVEAVIAPAFEEEALEVLTKKPNIRLMYIGEEREPNRKVMDIRHIDGGLLVQDMDTMAEHREDMKVVTKQKPTEEQWGDMLFGWRVVKYVLSNAIVMTRNNHTVGIGAGQMSRVDATRLAIEKANKKQLVGASLASDAFFPFRDAIDTAAKNGIKAIIQPGGSVRDDEVIAACNKHGIAMVFSGKRHFRH